jgi:hypothetical protein
MAGVRSLHGDGLTQVKLAPGVESALVSFNFEPDGKPGGDVRKLFERTLHELGRFDEPVAIEAPEIGAPGPTSSDRFFGTR